MLKSLKKRVAKLEEHLNWDEDIYVIIKYKGETTEEAIEKHLQEYPHHRGSEEPFIAISTERHHFPSSRRDRSKIQVRSRWSQDRLGRRQE